MKKYIMVIAPFFLLLAVIGLSVTYALFESNKNIDTEVEIAKWQVKINKDVIEGHNLNFTIDKVNWENNQYVKEGKAAPGLSGYFDIEIDPNNTETSIRYDVKFNFSSLNSSQFEIESIEELNDKQIVKTGINTYSNIIKLTDITNNEKNTLRVNIKWNNNDNNNEIDSSLGRVLNNKLQIPVEVTITQSDENDVLTPFNG